MSAVSNNKKPGLDDKNKELLASSSSSYDTEDLEREMQTSYSSDEEIKEIAKDSLLADLNKKIEASEITIGFKETDGSFKNIKGGELVKTVHDVVRTKYKELLKEFSLPTEEAGTIHIKEAKDWVMTLGGWKGMMAAAEVQHYAGYENKYENKKEKAKRFKQAKIYCGDQCYEFKVISNRVYVKDGFSVNNINITEFDNKKKE